MKCHTNDNSTSATQLPHTFSYIVAYLVTIILNHPIFRNIDDFFIEGGATEIIGDTIKDF
jgi:hypothetical protein